MKISYILAVCVALSLAAAAPKTPSVMTDEAVRDSYLKSYRYESGQDYRNAIKALVPVVTARPEDYTVGLRLGWLFYLNGNHANARACYEAAMRAQPASLEAKLGYTLPLLAQGKYDEAEAVARQILRLDASNYYANLRLAYALRMQGKFEAAAELLNRFLPLYPTDLKLLAELGLVCVARNQPEDARRLFTELRLLDPENATAQEQLASLRKAKPARTATAAP
jgi:Flp pilus assembly protein TadD